jgi:predicted LPLAT superfamily acyltransferase
MKLPNNSSEPSRSRWTGRSLGNRLGYAIFHALIRLGGRRLAYLGLYFVVAYYVACRPGVRKRSEPYLRHRFPEMNRRHYFLATYRMFLNLGKILIDRALVAAEGPAVMKLEVQGKDVLLDLVRQGRGFILLMSHVGCWQVAISALRFLNRPVNLLLEHDTGGANPSGSDQERAGIRLHIIDPRGYLGGTLEMLAVLKKSELLCIMGDRVSGGDRSWVPVDFLGAKAPFPFSAYKIASAAGVPVVVCFTAKTGVDRYTLMVARTIHIPENLGRSGECFAPFVAQFVEELEGYLRQYPYQFFNFYDMWQN